MEIQSRSRRCLGYRKDPEAGSGGKLSISRSKSWPLRYEFSVRRKRTVPRGASISKKMIHISYMSESFATYLFQEMRSFNTAFNGNTLGFYLLNTTGADAETSISTHPRRKT